MRARLLSWRVVVTSVFLLALPACSQTGWGEAFLKQPERRVLFIGNSHTSFNSSDGHPTQEGSYLAACVLYGTISRETPVGNRHSGKGLTAETSAYLQQIAAATLGF